MKEGERLGKTESLSKEQEVVFSAFFQKGKQLQEEKEMKS